MHQGCASGNHRQARTGGGIGNPDIAGGVVGAEQALGGQPGSTGEAPGQPVGVAGQLLGVVARIVGGQQQGQATGQAGVEVGAGEVVATLFGGPAAAGDQAGEASVGGAVGGQQDQPGPVGQLQAGANDELDRLRLPLPGRVGPHHAGQGAFVGDRQRAVAEAGRLAQQLFRVRGAGEEAEAGAAVEFGKGGWSTIGHPLTV